MIYEKKFIVIVKEQLIKIMKIGLIGIIKKIGKFMVMIRKNGILQFLDQGIDRG